MSVFRTYIIVLASALIAVGCAQQVSPKGGAKDEQAPGILESSPQNGALNYTDKEIYFEFDEYVRVAGAKKELIVTPPLKYPVEFKMRKRKVYVTWTDTLLDHTTYLFQFGEGIVDVNEGNPLDSNIFVFSTGDYLDSMYLEGQVINAFDLKPVEDVWVMLYPENEDSLPYKELPRYFSKTDESGRYRLAYLSEGSYKVFALQSVNTGYLYDQPDEFIGFLDGLYKVNSPADTLAEDLPDLQLFVEEDTVQYLSKYEQVGNKGLVFQFNRPVEQLELAELTGRDIASWDAVWNSYADSVVYWFEAPLDYDSLKLQVKVEGFVDTLFLRKPSNKAKGKGKSKASSKEERIAFKVSSTAKIQHFKPFYIQSTTPLKSVDLERGLFVEEKDSMALAPKVKVEGDELIIDHKWKEGAKYRVFLPDSSIFDRFGLTNDTLRYNLTATKASDFGTLELSFTLPDYGYDYVLQLMDKNNKLVREHLVSPSGKLNYDFLATGAYKIKIIHDENGNGVWDTGNYLKHIQPERVAFYDQAIDIRSNWITELEWELKDGEEEEAEEDSGE